LEPDHPELSLVRQCELLGLARSSSYYTSVRDDAYNDRLRRLLDEAYTRRPYYGVARMTRRLREQGHAVNPKRVRRLLRELGLVAIYPKPRLSLAGQAPRRFPYLLGGLAIVRPDQVWSTDITYVRLGRGFVYLTAILDWFSRYVVAWEVSLNLETDFCLRALDRALAVKRPEIFNSDQGSQFTSAEFTGRLEAARVSISWDGKGRAYDNIFVERLWRSVKYEEVYLKEYPDVGTAERSLGAYFDFYNHERFHQSLGYATPVQVYCGQVQGVGGRARTPTGLFSGGASPTRQPRALLEPRKETPNNLPRVMKSIA